MRITRAGPADLDAASALFDGYRQFYGRPSDLAAARAFLADRIERDQSTIFLASDASGVLGFVQLYPSFTSLGMARIFILNDLFVRPEARGKGVGTALLRQAAAFARETGAVRLTLSTEIGNATAQAVYEREGWKRDEAFYVYTFALQ